MEQEQAPSLVISELHPTSHGPIQAVPHSNHGASPPVIQAKGGLKRFFARLFRRRRPEEELTDEEIAEVEEELRQLERGEAPVAPESELSEDEAEKMLAELELELGGDITELDEEETEAALKMLEAEAEAQEEVPMSSEELDQALDESEKLANELTERINALHDRQIALSAQYARLVKKGGKEEQADLVNAEFLAVTEQIETLQDASIAAWARYNELAERKNQLIGEALARPIDVGIDESEIEKELEELEEQGELGEEATTAEPATARRIPAATAPTVPVVESVMEPSTQPTRKKIPRKKIPRKAPPVVDSIVPTPLNAPQTSATQAPTLLGAPASPARARAESTDDDLQYLIDRELTPEEEAWLDEEIAEIEREMLEERQLEELEGISRRIESLPQPELPEEEEMKSKKSRESIRGKRAVPI